MFIAYYPVAFHSTPTRNVVVSHNLPEIIPDFSVVSINSGLADIINHCFTKHGETVRNMDFISMFREEEDE